MGERILLVDDEPRIVEVMGRFLRRYDYEILEAYGGAEAIEKINTEGKIDLAVVDLKMPEVNGIEVIKETRKKGVPVIVFTASMAVNTYRQDLEALGYDINDVLHKPIELKKFITAVEHKLKGGQKND
ncbi:MAG: response regulator [Endomicrobiales bacterium]|nr:response regulator [Endomicrobiales bacterium]